jgi:hypothetical protein
MPPDPTEQQFLDAAAALGANYATAISALEAQVDQVNANPILLTHGDWARPTSDLIATLRGLNAQARALPVPPRYAASWGAVLQAVDLLDVALNDLDEGVSLYNLHKIEEYNVAIVTAQEALAAAVPLIAPLPVVVVYVATPVVIPVASPAVDTVAMIPAATPAASVCNVCPTPTPALSVGKGGVVVGTPPAATATVIAPPASTAMVISVTVVPTMAVPIIAVPTVVVGIPITVPTGTPAVPLPAFASGGLGLTLEEWVAVHGQPDALAEGLYVFDGPEQTDSLLVVNGRISTIYVVWKPESRPNLAVAQGAVIGLLPLDAALVQAGTRTAERFVGQYHSAQLATVFPDAPYSPLPVGTFSVIYELASDGLVFHTTVTIGRVEP